MQIQKKPTLDAAKKPQEVTVKTVTSKGKISVDLNSVTPIAANQSEPKVTVAAKAAKKTKKAKLETKTAKVEPTLNERLAAIAEETSTVKFRAWMAVGLAAIVTILLALQFTGGDPEVATPTVSETVAPVVTSEPTETATNTAPAALGQSDNQELVNSIIGALRSTPAATPETGASVAGGDAGALNSLYTMVTGALSQGQSPAYIDQLLNEALKNGEISVPAGLILPSGQVDTTSILALFSTK